MKKILAIASSNHSKSINQQLLNYSAPLLSQVKIDILDISKWIIPIYSIDMDPDETPVEITLLIDLIKQSDGFILASPEHNGGTPAFLKNIIDWLSRRSKNVFENKPMLLMSASPGKTGGVNNRKILEHLLPYLGANIESTFSLPSYHQNMIEGKLNGNLLKQLQDALSALKNSKIPENN